MSITTELLPGVRLHPNGASYEVRIRPFPPRAGFQTATDANRYAIELRDRKSRGILVPPPIPNSEEALLHEIAKAYLLQLQTVGGKRGIPYSQGSMTAARTEARPWTGEPVKRRGPDGELIELTPAVDAAGRPFWELPLAALDVDSLEEYLLLRYVEAPRIAVGEYQMLMSILKLARRRGKSFDPLLFGINPPRRRKSKRSGLNLAELRFLAEHVQEHQRNLFLLGASLGNRIMELLRAEDAWLDLEAGLLTIPAWACKERREKKLYLLPEECKLFREQQLLRSPNTVRGLGGTRVLFPRRYGTLWEKHGEYWRGVVAPSRKKAAKAWRKLHDLGPDAPTPFEWTVLDEHGKQVIDPKTGKPKRGGWAPHDLRRGAAALMRELGLSPELAAARLGHKDAGFLLVTVYEDVREERLRAELDEVAADGGIDARLAKRKAVQRTKREANNG